MSQRTRTPEEEDFFQDSLELFDEWERRLRQEMREEGRKEVASLAVRALITLIENKFGALSSAQRERIQHGSPTELETWLVRVLEAASVDEVLNPLP